MSKIRTDAALAVSIIVVVLGSCIVYTAHVSAAVADDLIAAERLFHSRDDEAALEEAIAAYSALIENAELTVDQQYLCLKNLTLLHDFKGVNFCPERDQQMTVFQ